MKITVSFKHLEHTESLDSRIQEKSEKLNKFFDGKVHLKWTCWAQGMVHTAEAVVTGPNFEYRASAEADSLYKCLDMVTDKLEKQLSKKKEKVRSRRKASHSDLVILDPENAWMEHEDEYHVPSETYKKAI